MRLLVLQTVALCCVLSSGEESAFDQMNDELAASPLETVRDRLDKVRRSQSPFGDDHTLTFLDSEEQREYEHRIRHPRDRGTELGESADPAAADNEKKTNDLDDKPDPPLNITCWHELGGKQKDAVNKAAELKQESKAAGEKFVAVQIMKKEALQLSESARKDAEHEHKSIKSKQSVFEMLNIQTKGMLSKAREKAKLYKSLEEQVETMITRSKEAFTMYMKYKEQFIKASANAAGGASTSQEVRQYSKIAEQHLKAYHQLQVEIRTARQNANAASDRYKELSKRYQGMVAEARTMSEELEKVSDKYSRENARYRTEKRRFEKLSREEGEAVATQKYTADESDVQSKNAKNFLRDSTLSKRRYWELFAMIEKYTAQIVRATEKSKLQSLRWARLDKKRAKLEAEQGQQSQDQKNLNSKVESAKSAGKLFMQNYKDMGCATELDADALANQKAAQEKAAAENKETENPISSATKPSMEAIRYNQLYSKFAKQYTAQASEKTEGKRSQAELGDSKYSRCSYFTKLATMYSQLQQVHHKLTKHSDQLNDQLQQQQKTKLNRERSDHYEKLMKQSCAQMTIATGSKFSSRKMLSAMEDSLWELNDSDQDAEIDLGDGEDDTEEEEEDEEAAKAEKCERFKQVATANLEATAASKMALQTQNQFLLLVSESLNKTNTQLKEASTQREGAQQRVKRFTQIVEGASRDIKTPCPEQF